VQRLFMKVRQRTITVKSNQREEMIEITRQVGSALPEGDGIVVLLVQHTTCGLTVNENADPDVQSDMLGWLRHVVPQFPSNPQFRHFEHNSDAHIKASLMGSSVTVPFEDGRLCLGRWQGIYLCEFDGPRERTIVLQRIKAKG
jgi:secondary thiamine-phosphate synthase enzyme